MGLKPYTIDETPKPLVAIPRPRWKFVASFLPALLLAGFAAAARDPFARWLWMVFVGIAAIVALFQVLAWASYPEFAVGRDGIRLPTQQSPLWSRLRMRDLGLYAWEAVSYCQWSLYEPGVLNIQVKAIRSLDGGPDPPFRVHYRVPEPHRSDVEKAIRAMGKWAD
jgi:hypothetical protein